MSRVLVWDIPIRLFHALFAAGLIAAAVISLGLGDDSSLFPYHAQIGLVITLLVGLRVVWGLVGSRYARFSSFAFGPVAVGQYMKATLFGGGARTIGHNPGAAWGIFAMLALMIGLATTGIMMGRGNDSVEEVHEVLSYVMVGVAIAHVLGVILHTIKHRENIVASMIHGRKDAEPAAGIRSSHRVATVVFLILAGAWSVELVRNFDATTQSTTLPALGVRMQLGEVENEGGEGRGSHDEPHEEDD